ncbi:MAG TPA: type I-D CRISPR-associated endonuclease Cas1d [Ktedonobacteraceae bacterium]|nr:type I-D CRISPR-associated endonuclease Cas1d [Ktedonobacteraceae bacterium]
MAILYLTEQQAWVGREGECLVVHLPAQPNEDGSHKKREQKKQIPLFKIEEVIVLGDITLTTPALASLLEAQVPITYLSKHARYLGKLSPSLTKNSLLRLAQHTNHASLARRHALAQRFVIGKLRNMKTLLMRYQRARPDQTLTTHIESLKACLQAAESSGHTGQTALEEMDPEDEGEEQTASEESRMHGLGSLLGCEGAGSAAYFRVFGQLIKCDWPHGFIKRTRRPPTDPVNAMLSYGYVILTNQVASMLATVGFDPYIGYLHASRYGKPALALDLMEEFRPIIVDSVVLNLLNNRQLEAKDFRRELNSYQMTDTTRRLFLQKFEERMQETIIHPTFGYRASYRRCIELQARLLAKYLMEEIKEYPPFTVR